MAIRLTPQAESVLRTGDAVRCAEISVCMIILECCRPIVKVSKIAMQKPGMLTRPEPSRPCKTKTETKILETGLHGDGNYYHS